ncbi:retrovirus-related pol polyprotein from transposon TNT 1-94 [Tanacetum coccineum]
MNINDPLYIASSDHPGMILTNTLFNGSNIHRWSRNIKWALVGHNLKLGFIDGSCISQQVIMKICKVGLYVITFGNMLDLEFKWLLKLSDIFLLHLKKCLNELHNINGMPTCNCGKMRECTCSVLEKFALRDSNSKLIQFLMKLNNEYESVRSQILAMDPLPTVNKGYYIVQQIQKQNKVTNHVFEPTAFFANMNNKNNSNGRRENNKGNRNEIKVETENEISFKKVCTNCGQEGHLFEQCFERLGYPDWYKGNKAKKNNRLAAHVNLGFDEHFSGETPFDMEYENEVGLG